MENKETEIMYSIDDENYKYTDPKECIRDHMDDLPDDDLRIGFVGHIYQGEAVYNKASYYLKNNASTEIIDGLSEDAMEHVHEDDTPYLERVSMQDEANLQAEIARAVDKWAKETGNEPDFFYIKNEKKIRYRITKIPDNNLISELSLKLLMIKKRATRSLRK